MVTFAEDPNTGDLLPGPDGAPFLVYGADAVAVLCARRLRQQPGEDRLQPGRGFPRALVLGKFATPGPARSVAMQMLSTVAGVIRVSMCEVTVDASSAAEATTIEAVVETSEGPTPVKSIFAAG